MSKELIAAAELELLLSKREQWAPFGLLGMAQYVNGRIAQLRAQAAQESAAQVPVSASAGEHPTPSTPDAADRVAGWKMVPVEPTEEMLKLKTEK